MIEVEAPPHDAHVVEATKVFRDAGFTLAAMQYPRPADALQALREFNRVPDGHPVSKAWSYFPNAWCRDYWHARLSERVA